VAACAAVLPLVLIGCKASKRDADQTWADQPGPKVVVSFAPLYCFAANVAGNDASVQNVMSNVGPHEFNPTEKDARLVSKADILFVNGLGLDEAMAQKMKEGSGNANLKIIELGEVIPKDKRCEGHCDHANHGPDHQHGDDPHVWMSPELAVLMVNKIRDELKAIDPAHAGGYDSRAADYVKRLEALKATGLEKLKGKKDNRLVSFHDSLSYFEKCFGLEIRGVLTQKAGQEPDEKQLRKLIRICTDENKPTRVIAVEPQFSNSTAGETLRKELAAKGVKNPVLVEIDTLETVEPKQLTPDWYERKILENIDKLAAALE
jgi:ABC-type Zn uptake system ZnuABC Zn-binding protein ZnuA